MAAMKALSNRTTLENSADRLGDLGFEDPGIDTLRAELLRELGIKKKTFFDALVSPPMGLWRSTLPSPTTRWSSP